MTLTKHLTIISVLSASTLTPGNNIESEERLKEIESITNETPGLARKENQLLG